MTAKKRHKRLLLLLILGIGAWLFTYGPLAHITKLFSSLDMENIKNYILSFGIWAPVVSFLLMMFQSLVAPLPAFLITFANAALFGWVKGALLSWSSAMAGAALCFYISRALGREAIEKKIGQGPLKTMDVFFSRHGKNAILIARLLPFISFDFISYGAGLTSMSFSSFMIATGIGQLPATLIYSYAGSMLTGTTKTFVFGLLMLMAFGALAYLAKELYEEKRILGDE